MMWFNNRTCGPLFPQVKEAFCSYSDFFGSLENIRSLLAKAEESIRALTGCSPEDYVFRFLGNGGHPASSLFPAVFLNSSRHQGKNGFLIPATAEKQYIATVKNMQIYGSQYDWVPCTDGIIKQEALIASLSPRTLLFSFSLVNGLTGIIQPWEEIFDICKQRDILIHVDISHGLGKIPLTPLNTQADFISFSGISLNGIPGTGGIFIKKKLFRNLQVFFPDFNETHPSQTLAGNIALGETALCLAKESDFINLEINRLKHLLEDRIIDRIPTASIVFEGIDQVPDVTVVHFEGIAAESLAFILNQNQIYPALGNNIFQSLPEILQASGISATQAFSCLSFALSPFIIEKDIASAITHIAGGVDKLMSHITEDIRYDF
ncbi:MAG: aminotransferase class V-fold PLP-dependent enzyme [Victivallaceae bacterium]